MFYSRESHWRTLRTADGLLLDTRAWQLIECVQVVLDGVPGLPCTRNAQDAGSNSHSRLGVVSLIIGMWR
jgi:hypothetical protein